jgi:hypothetical protein
MPNPSSPRHSITSSPSKCRHRRVSSDTTERAWSVDQLHPFREGIDNVSSATGLQDPQATAWLALGYGVRKEEQCRIRVWARCEPSRKKLLAWRDAGAEKATKPKAFYRLEAVFDKLSRERCRCLNARRVESGSDWTPWPLSELAHV